MMYPWWGGRTVFTASGLSTEGGSGDAWGFDAAGTCSEATVAAAAAALGVSGQPRLEYGTWTVGPNDGSGASVSLSPDGLASLSYYDPTRDPWNCVRSGAGRASASRDGRAGRPRAASRVPEPAIVDPPAECTTSEPAPTGDAAVAQAKDVAVVRRRRPRRLPVHGLDRPGQPAGHQRDRQPGRSTASRPGSRPTSRSSPTACSRCTRRWRRWSSWAATTSSARPRPWPGWATRGSAPRAAVA